MAWIAISLERRRPTCAGCRLAVPGDSVLIASLKGMTIHFTPD